MNTATARRPKSLGSCPTEKKAVSLNQDAQLQKLLKDGWEIAQEGAIEIRLTKPGGKTLTHRRRAVAVFIVYSLWHFAVDKCSTHSASVKKNPLSGIFQQFARFGKLSNTFDFDRSIMLSVSDSAVAVTLGFVAHDSDLRSLSFTKIGSGYLCACKWCTNY